MPSCNNFTYMMLNLVGEVGELASKVAKDVRKGNGNIYDNELWIGCHRTESEREAREMELKHEAGDILWQLSGLCHAMDGSLRMWQDATLRSLPHANREVSLMARETTDRII